MEFSGQIKMTLPMIADNNPHENPPLNKAWTSNRLPGC
jgi:hypothetical protein